MPAARVCDCGHVASNHRIVKVQYVEDQPIRATTYYECLYDGCDCEQFIEEFQISARLVNYR